MINNNGLDMISYLTETFKNMRKKHTDRFMLDVNNFVIQDKMCEKYDFHTFLYFIQSIYFNPFQIL